MKVGGPWAAGGLAIALALVGCAHSKIPNTNIDDTRDNREVLALVEDYKKAVESLDAEAVLALVSPTYFEDNGNTDTSDDYDYDELGEGLRASFERTKAMQLVLRVDAIEVKDDRGFAEVYYEYRAHNDYPAGMKWDTGTDRARLELAKDAAGRWRIVAGL